MRNGAHLKSAVEGVHAHSFALVALEAAQVALAGRVPAAAAAARRPRRGAR